MLDAPILVVDDTAVSRSMIGALLRAEGFRNIDFAADGIEALQRIAAACPDLVILDIMMPRLDGIALCRGLRADPATADLPVLVQTALSDMDDRAQIFRAGASDIIGKPVNRVELIARARLQIERRLMLRRITAEQERLAAELRAARQMQAELLPQGRQLRDIELQSGLRFGAHVATSSELGGDIWGIISLDARRVGIYSVDFSGHGVTAALNTFRLHTLIAQYVELRDDPAQFLAALNARLCALLSLGQFATMLYGIFDTEAGSFRFASAGSPLPILCPAGGTARYLPCAGVPLGIMRDATYDEQVIAVAPGDSLVLCSDGLTEYVTAEGGRLDEAQVLAACAGLRDAAGPQALVEALCRTLGVSDDRAPADDLTVIAVARR